MPTAVLDVAAVERVSCEIGSRDPVAGIGRVGVPPVAVVGDDRVGDEIVSEGCARPSPLRAVAGIDDPDGDIGAAGRITR
jgi:hypothetical protein